MRIKVGNVKGGLVNRFFFWNKTLFIGTELAEDGGYHARQIVCPPLSMTFCPDVEINLITADLRDVQKMVDFVTVENVRRLVEANAEE